MIQKKCTEIHDTVRENENKEKWAVKEETLWLINSEMNVFQPNKTRLFCDNGTVRYIITPRTETATKMRGGVIAALLLQACSLQLL